jgi:hypothetical protein
VHNHYHVDDDDGWKKHRHHDDKERKQAKHDREWKERGDHRAPVVIYRYRIYSPDSQAPPMSPGPAKPRAKAQPSFPRESATDRAAAKERQREILEKGLAAEQRLLARARRRLVELPGAESDDTRLRSYEDDLQNHGQKALRRELRNLER